MEIVVRPSGGAHDVGKRGATRRALGRRRRLPPGEGETTAAAQGLRQRLQDAGDAEPSSASERDRRKPRAVVVRGVVQLQPQQRRRRELRGTRVAVAPETHGDAGDPA